MHLKLPAEPSPGRVFDRKMEHGDGYFQIQVPPGAATTSSWNTEMDWVLKVDQWNREPFDPSGRTFQQGGTASGHLYICFKGWDGKIKSSFVAGVFENAPIVYFGKPKQTLALAK